ncbi:MAG: hypothetical protein KDA38_11870 [Planctomycetales bacterium]|nr:hypothetical protein [Planctomycetales bacterium]
MSCPGHGLGHVRCDLALVLLGNDTSRFTFEQNATASEVAAQVENKRRIVPFVTMVSITMSSVRVERVRSGATCYETVLV